MYSQITFRDFITRNHDRIYGYSAAKDVLAREACETDNAQLMEEAIVKTASYHLEKFYFYLIPLAYKNNAVRILRMLVDRGVDIKPEHPSSLVGAPKETLEFLLACGWDINERRDDHHDRRPFMWHYVQNHDMIEWCLDHGASVHPAGQKFFQDNPKPETKNPQDVEQILEHVARRGAVQTFKLLRSRGAPLGWRPLHYAVAAAIDPSYTPTSPEYLERLAMVRHLLEVEQVDVNALDQPPGTRTLRMHFGSPLCYVVVCAERDNDRREIIWLLLDHGADPKPALEHEAKGYSYATDTGFFAREVAAWKKQQPLRRKCCVQ